MSRRNKIVSSQSFKPEVEKWRIGFAFFPKIVALIREKADTKKRENRKDQWLKSLTRESKNQVDSVRETAFHFQGKLQLLACK